MNDEYKKVLDKELKHQKWARFIVFVYAFTPGWLGIIVLLGYIFVCFMTGKHT